MNSQLHYQVTPQISTCYIEIISGMFQNPQLLAQLLKDYGKQFAIICDTTTAQLYGKFLCQLLRMQGIDSDIFILPSGEIHKTRAWKENIEDAMFEKSYGRDCCVVALGGGVVSDLAGYLAATYCRGVSFVIMPTTLLSMCDAAIGGKNGVNTSHGKNLVGSIYQPKKVIIDPLTLASLPIFELKNGIVEMIKHGAVADETYFAYLETYSQDLLALETSSIETAIRHSCYIKKNIVEVDEQEKGRRSILNFGHTIGHALEKISDYAMPHGEAVAIGMLIEGHLSLQAGYLCYNDLERLFNLLIQYELPLEIPNNFSYHHLETAMSSDKKSIDKRPRFILLKSIGTPVEIDGNFCVHVPEDFIKNAFAWLQDALCCH